ncbi:MAG TPA: WecB/TagA/CpsF family glycosyltransferase [Candidatus Acidoferrum sp.]|nr:WecB/TagA/CpsF family glycosyltransferase [Candidatus Acidoferrum sp.]
MIHNIDKINIVNIFGISFNDMSYTEARKNIYEMIVSEGTHQIVLANAHTLNLAYCNLEYQKYLQQATLVLRDGTGVKLASILVGQHLRCNFVGTDFIPRLLGDLCKENVGIFLFGARPGVAQAAAMKLQSNYPHITIVGYEHGYVPREEWDGLLVERINRTQPHILLVALGNPLQEVWIAENLSRLNVKVAIGVGALFDYLAGEVSRAPKWMRKIGFEWLYRLIVEPRRLWRRYLIGNCQFLYRVIFHS